MTRPRGWEWARASVVAFVAAWLLVAGWPEPLELAVAAAEGVALAFAHRVPLVALATAFAALVLVPDGAGEESPYLLAMLLAAFHVGRFASVSRQPWAAAAVLALVSGALFDGGEPVVADAAFPVFLIGGPWLVGLVAQLTQNRADRAVDYARSVDDLRAAELRGALAEERLRIAQDLHDVVAHNITALSLQAQLARRDVLAGVSVGEETLREMEHTAQAAMADVRRALGVLRTPDDPQSDRQPGLADLPDLVATGRAVGHRIVITVDGEPQPLAPALDAAAHRILQEALTNARRHGAPGTTTVCLRWSPGTLGLTVRNPAPEGEVAVGHGITGIAERARMLGGSARTSRQDGEWRVAVSLPLPAAVVTA